MMRNYTFFPSQKWPMALVEYVSLYYVKVGKMREAFET